MNYPRGVGHAASGQQRNTRRALRSLLRLETVWHNRACGKTESLKPDGSVAPLSDPLHQHPGETRLQHPGVPRATLPQRDTRELPSEIIHRHLRRTPSPREIQLDSCPFLYATPISFFAGPPHQNLLGTTRVGLLPPQDEKAQRRGNLYCGTYIISPVNACVWPGFLGRLDRAVDTVQSSLLSVPNKMAIKAQVRGHSPQAISTPKWLIIIMCGLNQEPVMSRIH